MELVSKKLVEKAGINVDELLKLLISNAAAELTTFYYYTALRINLIGFEGEGLKEIFVHRPERRLLLAETGQLLAELLLL